MHKHKYEIIKDGKLYCSYDDDRLHYDESTLKNMKSAGYKVYINGKLWKESKKIKRVKT